jgi:hypothetical protein
VGGDHRAIWRREALDRFHAPGFRAPKHSWMHAKLELVMGGQLVLVGLPLGGVGGVHAALLHGVLDDQRGKRAAVGLRVKRGGGEGVPGHAHIRKARFAKPRGERLRQCRVA